MPHESVELGRVSEKGRLEAADERVRRAAAERTGGHDFRPPAAHLLLAKKADLSYCLHLVQMAAEPTCEPNGRGAGAGRAGDGCLHPGAIEHGSR
jgi:hypothetical protein